MVPTKPQNEQEGLEATSIAPEGSTNNIQPQHKLPTKTLPHWHPVVFLKSGTTPTNVVLHNSMSNVCNGSMVSMAYMAYITTLCLNALWSFIGSLGSGLLG